MAIFIYRLVGDMTVAKPFSSVAFVTSLLLLVFTARFVHFWVSRRRMAGGV
jgi:hypothetical protein